jgi:hypothetical protein
LAATRTALATAEAGLSGRRHELDAAQRALAESRSLTGGLRAELTGARASGRIIVNSSSWKLTKPLRQLIEALSYVGELGLARTISSMVKRNFVKQLHLRRQLAVVEESGMFDASWYLAQSPDAAQTQVEPVRHYLLFGAAEGLDPHPLFDTSWYLERYPDVGRAGLNPLVHYLVRGALEGRHPHPHCDTAATSEHPTDVALADIPRPTPVLRRQPLTARLDPSRCLALDREGPWLMCVSHVRPDPPRAGNAYRIQRMLRWAANTGYRVLLIHAPLPEEEPSDDALAELASVYPHLVVCRRDGRIHYRFEDGAEVPAALAHLHGRPAKGCPGDGPETNRRAAELHAIERTFAHDTLVETVLALADTLKPSVVLAEYVFMTRFFPRLPAETLKVIDTHDVFSTKGKKVERYGIRDSLALSAGEESRYLARADVIIAIQPDEAKDLSRLAPGKRVVTAGVDFDLVPLPPAAQSRVVLLIGSGNAMNVRAAEDFVRFAWPLIRRQVPEAELWMAGRVSQVATFQSTGVNPLGLVEDLDPLYRAARVTINPVVAGTGVKIKTLESLSRLRPVVCWPTGVEGLGPELRAHCSLADNWYDFAVQVIRQLQDDTPQSALWSAQDRLGPLLAAQAVYSDLHTALATTSATIEARAP